jgi:hypothetical protein
VSALVLQEIDIMSYHCLRRDRSEGFAKAMLLLDGTVESILAGI